MRQAAVGASAGRVRAERERIIVKLRGIGLAFAAVQSVIAPGDSLLLTWVNVGLLAVGWSLSRALVGQRSERAWRRAGVAGMALDTIVVVLVLANNLDDPLDPVFLVVFLPTIEAALRWGRVGGFVGGAVAGTMAGVWGWWLAAEHGSGSLEHLSMRFFAVTIVGAITGNLVHRLDLERGRLAELAYTDALTGLANRPALHERMATALAADDCVALVFLDLDEFKAVNDQFGHTEGDAVLVAVAARLQAGVRPGDLVARLGGDEFVVVVTGEATATVDAMVERLRDTVLRPITVGDRTVRIGVSCGVVQARSGDHLDTLLRRADRAMYEAKRANRGAA